MQSVEAEADHLISDVVNIVAAVIATRYRNAPRESRKLIGKLTQRYSRLLVLALSRQTLEAESYRVRSAGV